MELSLATVYKAAEAGPRFCCQKRRGGTGATVQGKGNEATTVEAGSLEAHEGGPPGGTRRGPRVQSRPIRISGRIRRGTRVQSRPIQISSSANFAISVGRWRSFSGALIGPAGATLPSVLSGQAGLFAELSISNRESPLSEPLLELLGILAARSPGWYESNP